MRQKLFKRYFGATAVIVVFSFSVILLILTFFYNNYLAEEKYKLLQKSCDSVSDFVESNTTEAEFLSDEKGIYYILHNISDISGLDVYVTDTSGVIMVCSCDEWNLEYGCEHKNSQINMDVISRVISDSGRALSTLDIYSNPHYANATILKSSEGNHLGYVVSADSIDGAKELMKNVARLYLFSAIVPIALMFFALYIMTYRLTRPLKLMSQATHAMARGDFSKRIPVTSDDEIGQLAVSFNQMTNSLARLEETRKSFVANISHELKTPMTTIGGFIDGMIDGTIEPDRQSYYLQIVSDEVKRLSRMVQSMLSLARLESGEFALKPEKFDFREQILSIVISQEQRIEKKQLNVVGLDELPAISITADKDLIYRAVYNLVDNAIKFIDEQGTLSFAIKFDTRNVTFRIENTGKGIPENELPYIFERFYKIDKSRSANKTSTGLGLYIVKTIVKNHGGTITVSSVEDKFTAFEFTLPINK